MYILTQSQGFENPKNNIYHVQGTDLEKQCLGAGYQRYERSYKIRYKYKEYTVICLEFRDDKNGSEPIVIIPEFLVPRRPYPVFIYLYAIDLYSGAPEKGQRWAAAETRKQFGLASFAHTTLGRALKVFVRNIEKTIKVLSDNCIETSDNSKGKSGAQKTNTEQCGMVKKPAFPTVQSTEALRKRAAQFLNGMLTRSVKQQTIDICYELVRKWFKEYCQFLI